MLKPVLFLLSFIFSIVQLHAQDDLPEKDVYSEVERTMTVCDFDKDAEAVILFDHATLDYDIEFHPVTIRRVRIKILNDKGMERRNISIRFRSKDKFEYIDKIAGTTYNWNNSTRQSETFTLDKNKIITEKIDDYFSNIKFSLPSVEVGSIIEFTYRSVRENYYETYHWNFQSEIPTIRSIYRITVMPALEFSYIVSKKEEYPIIIKKDINTASVYFEMNNIPGLRDEPFMNAANDYLQRVEFQISSYNALLHRTTTVYDSWTKMAKEMVIDMEVGDAIKKELPGTNEIATLLSGENTEIGKLKKIYEYVQSNYTWNHINGLHTNEPLKKIVEKKSGTSGELNLLLTNLLRIFEIEAYPMFAAERDHGRVNPAIPMKNRFNKTVVFAIADGKQYILDITEKNCPYYVIPYQLLNTYALIINNKTKEPVFIKSGGQMYNSLISVSSKIDANGVMTGHFKMKNTQYAIQYYKDFVNDSLTNITKAFPEVDSQKIIVNGFTTNITKGRFDTLIYEFDFKKDLSEGANKNSILLKSNLFAGNSKNLFTRDIRFSDVNFGYPIVIMLQHEIELPAGYTPELPEDKSASTPESDITIIRNVEKNENKLIIKITFMLNTTFYPVSQYEVLKKFYKEMHELLDESISIKIR